MSSVELGIFDYLDSGPRSADDIIRDLKLHERGATDFLDSLVALALLSREKGYYSNSPDVSEFLVTTRTLYVGDVVRMADERLYGFWRQLTPALRTGRPQNEAASGEDQFDAIYSDPARLQLFAKAMSGVSTPAALRLATIINWRDTKTVVDVGCAEGIVPILLARGHPHLKTVGIDVPAMAPRFAALAESSGVSERARFLGIDIFSDDEWPHADTVIMGHILHNFDLERRRRLLAQAFRSLSSRGQIIVYDAMIDDNRRQHVVGLLMSLNMLVETPSGADYTFGELRSMLREAGFMRSRVRRLTGFDWFCSAIKP